MRRLAPALLTLTALFALTGCIKLDADIEVHEDETVSGAMTIGMSKQALKMMESMADSFGADEGDAGEFDDEFFEEGDIPPGATVEPFEDSKFVGQTMRFQDISFEELNASMSDTSEDEWTLAHEGGTYMFEGVLDLSDEDAEAADEELGLDGLFAESDLQVTLTFPGDVQESNGEIDGNSVTWRPKFGESLTMTAEADDTASFPVLAVVGGVLAALVVLIVVVLLIVMVRRRRATTAPAETLDEDETPLPHQS